MSLWPTYAPKAWPLPSVWALWVELIKANLRHNKSDSEGVPLLNFGSIDPTSVHSTHIYLSLQKIPGKHGRFPCSPMYPASLHKQLPSHGNQHLQFPLHSCSQGQEVQDLLLSTEDRHNHCQELKDSYEDLWEKFHPWITVCLRGAKTLKLTRTP